MLYSISNIQVNMLVKHGSILCPFSDYLVLSAATSFSTSLLQDRWQRRRGQQQQLQVPIQNSAGRPSDSGRYNGRRRYHDHSL